MSGCSRKRMFSFTRSSTVSWPQTSEKRVLMSSGKYTSTPPRERNQKIPTRAPMLTRASKATRPMSGRSLADPNRKSKTSVGSCEISLKNGVSLRHATKALNTANQSSTLTTRPRRKRVHGVMRSSSRGRLTNCVRVTCFMSGVLYRPGVDDLLDLRLVALVARARAGDHERVELRGVGVEQRDLIEGDRFPLRRLGTHDHVDP